MDKEKTKLSKRFAERLKRVKKAPKEINGVRKDKSRLIATTIWFILITILFFSILGAWLSLNTRSSLNETNKVVEAKQQEDDAESFNVITANEYISDFVRVFVNVQNDDELLNERAENLRSYFVYSQEFNNESNDIYTMPDLKGDRILNSLSLFNVIEEDNHYVMQYKVNVTNKIKKEVEKGRGKKKKKEVETEEHDQELLLNIPVLMEEGTYSVKSVPYFTEVYSLNGNIEIEEEGQTVEEYNGAERENIISFVAHFFEKYATEDTKEMGYIMKEPSSLNGAFLFDEMRDTKIIAEKDKFRVSTNVVFREELTNIPHVNRVELLISENNNNYFVEKLNYN